MNEFDHKLVRLLRAPVSIELTADDFFLSIERRFPIFGSKIDWALVPSSVHSVASTDECNYAEFFDKAVKTSKVSNFVYAGDGLTTICITAGVTVIASALNKLIEIPQHHYFYNEKARFCISFTLEGDMHYGFSPSCSI